MQARAETKRPPPDGDRRVLVEQFDSTPKTYFDEESGIQLRVGPGCLSEGQTAGPIVVIMDKRYIVRSGGSLYWVSAVVDCQPSGAIFRNPLSLQFYVGEGDEGSDSSEDEDAKENIDWKEAFDGSEDEDAKKNIDLDDSRQDDQGRQEYLTRLNSTHKVTWQSKISRLCPHSCFGRVHVLKIVSTMRLAI